MKKFVLAAMLALGVAAISQQQASAWNPIRLGVNLGCANYSVTLCFDGPNGCGIGSCGGCSPCGPCGGGCGSGCGPCGAGPWYSYYPYPAYFQAPPPVGFPYWPSMNSMSMGCAYYGH
jgi:hypothetical protein